MINKSQLNLSQSQRSILLFGDIYLQPEKLTGFITESLFRYFEWRRDFITQNKPSPICEVCREMREIYYKPSQIDMLEYLGVNR